MKSKTFGFLVVFLAVFGLILPWQSQAEESAPMTITHSVQTYTDDGPTMTVTLSLDVQNISAAGMSDITIALFPMPAESLPPTEEPEKLSIGSLASGQATTATYTLTSHIIYSETDMADNPILWEVYYLDDTNQGMEAVMESQGATQGGGQ